MSVTENGGQPQDLPGALRYFGDPRVCVRVIASARWPEGITCPHCGGTRVRVIATRCLWECGTKHPGRQFSVRVGTVFEDSALGLDKWLAVIWLLANGKKRVSSRQIQRVLGVTQKTGWLMLRRLWLAMDGARRDSRQVACVDGARDLHAGAARDDWAGPAAASQGQTRREIEGRARAGEQKSVC